MNYRHDYHAGNFADVVKHVVLTRILLHLARKPAPFRYIETHAGSGAYDLTGAEAQATGEWRGGIGRILAAELPRDVHDLAQPYLDIVGPSVRSASPCYLGSPAIAAALLRPQDRMLFCELHPEARRRLDARLGRDRRAKVIAIDGYVGLNAFVPPVERRGLVLIDPPFESPTELGRLAAVLAAAWRKWRTGLFLVWYPVKDAATVDAFMTSLLQGRIERMLRLELQVDDPAPKGPLARTGLLVINPPFGLDGEARQILPGVAGCLATGRAEVSIEWLRPE
jgi:23S rRNA (adenine2030-N6)-methyltransferase